MLSRATQWAYFDGGHQQRQLSAGFLEFTQGDDLVAGEAFGLVLCTMRRMPWPVEHCILGWLTLCKLGSLQWFLVIQLLC